MFVYKDCEYYAFAAYKGDVYEVTCYRNSGNPYTVKTLVPHAREDPSHLEAWVTANKNAFIRHGKNAWRLVTVECIILPINDKLTFWVEKWT